MTVILVMEFSAFQKHTIYLFLFALISLISLELLIKSTDILMLFSIKIINFLVVKLHTTSGNSPLLLNSCSIGGNGIEIVCYVVLWKLFVKCQAVVVSICSLTVRGHEREKFGDNLFLFTLNRDLFWKNKLQILLHLSFILVHTEKHLRWDCDLILYG